MTNSRKKLVENVECEVTGRAAAEQETSSSSLAQKVEKTRSPRQKSYVMDLRIHSPASLEYHGIDGLDAAPALVRLARVKGLDVIAVTDFFSGEFVDRVVDAAKGSSITVVPGVVIRCVVGSCRDVTISCLFAENTNTSRLADFLSALNVPRQAFGDRNYVIQKPLAEILQVLERFEGVAIPSRMDKTPHRLSVVPELVDKYGFRAFDLAYADSVRFFRSRWPKTKFQLFSFSNANALAQVGSRTARVKMAVPGFAGIKELVTRISIGS